MNLLNAPLHAVLNVYVARREHNKTVPQHATIQIGFDTELPECKSYSEHVFLMKTYLHTYPHFTFSEAPWGGDMEKYPTLVALAQVTGKKDILNEKSVETWWRMQMTPTELHFILLQDMGDGTA